MAEIDKRILQYNQDKTAFESWLKFCYDNKIDTLMKPTCDAILNIFEQRKENILEKILIKKGLEVCRFADTHFFCAPPDNWRLGESEWRLGLFAKTSEKYLYRAEIIKSYGRNHTTRIENPELLIVCPEHYLHPYSFQMHNEAKKDGWHTSMLSGVTKIGDKLHPIADRSITIGENVTRKRPEYVYRHFGIV